jgi:hypothetical protein
MMNLASDITDYITNVIARPCKQSEAISEIIKMATHNPAWPKASYEQWQAAIDQAVASGKLTRVSETVWIPVKVVEKKAVQKEMF